MKPRHLFAAIEERDEFFAEQLLEQLQKQIQQEDTADNAKSFLLATHDNGKSFLHLSLEVKLLNLALKLHTLLIKYEHSALFSTTNDKQTLIHAAVLSGSVDLLEQYIRIFTKHKQNWMQADAHGNTPLHLAVDPARVSCLEFLIKKISETCPQQLVALNRDGETAMIVALKKSGVCDYRLICPFTVVGGIWEIRDNDHVSAFDYFANKTPAAQQIILNQISIIDRHHLREFARKSQSNQKKYLRLCEMHSLTSLAAAHCEFNATVPLVEINKIPKDILDLIPHYRQRLINKTSTAIQNEQDDLQDEQDEFTKARAWLRDLIRPVSEYHQHLLTLKPSYDYKKPAVLAVLFSVMGICCIYMIFHGSFYTHGFNAKKSQCQDLMLPVIKASEKMLAYAAPFVDKEGREFLAIGYTGKIFTDTNNYHFASSRYDQCDYELSRSELQINGYRTMLIAGSVFLISIITIAALFYRFYRSWWLTEKLYSHHHHIAMIQHLQTELVDRLMATAADQRLASDTEIQVIQQELTTLSQDDLLLNTVQSVSRLENQLNVIKGNLCVSPHLALTMFANKKAEAQVIDMNNAESSEEDSIDGEDEPLMVGLRSVGR